MVEKDYEKEKLFVGSELPTCRASTVQSLGTSFATTVRSSRETGVGRRILRRQRLMLLGYYTIACHIANFAVSARNYEKEKFFVNSELPTCRTSTVQSLRQASPHQSLAKNQVAWRRLSSAFARLMYLGDKIMTCHSANLACLEKEYEKEKLFVGSELPTCRASTVQSLGTSFATTVRSSRESGVGRRILRRQRLMLLGYYTIACHIANFAVSARNYEKEKFFVDSELPTCRTSTVQSLRQASPHRSLAKNQVAWRRLSSAFARLMYLGDKIMTCHSANLACLEKEYEKE